MASNIKYTTINENFPLAGQDNDTQEFRDNFNIIKTSLGDAYTEVTALQNNTAKLNVNNDFAEVELRRGVFYENKQLFYGTSSNNTTLTIDASRGSYQRHGITAVIDIRFDLFPTAAGNYPGDRLSKVTVELFSATVGQEYLLTFQQPPNSGVIKYSSNFPTASNFKAKANSQVIEAWAYRAAGTNFIYLNYLGEFAARA